MFIFDLTPDVCASDGHTNSPAKAPPFRTPIRGDAEAASIVFFQEYDASINIKTEKFHEGCMKNMDLLEIRDLACNAQHAYVLGKFPSDLLPTHSLRGLIRYTEIINSDIHRKHGGHWAAVHI
jgi:hypothetical protein